MKAVFFDVDGTLVSFDTHTVPESAKIAIKRMREKGIKAFVATGRARSMLKVLDDIEFDGFITYNGGCCENAAGDEIFSMPIPVEQLQRLNRRLEREGFAVSYMRRDGMYVNDLLEPVINVANHVNVAPPVVMHPNEIIQKPVYQLCIYLEDDERVNSILQEELAGCISNRWISWFADVNRAGVTKQLGIDKIIEHYSIGIEDTMSFGDAANDIPMIKHAAVGVAMGNASDSVKAVADYITATVDDDGIYKALKHYNLL